MKKVLLLGSYGQTNLGDDLLMWNYLTWLRNRGYNRVYTNAVRPYLVPKIIRKSFPDMQIIETYKTNMRDWMRMLREVDFAIYGGGTIYKEMYASTGRNKHGVTLRMAGFNRLARMLNVPVYNLNIGTGSIRTSMGRSIARRGLRASTFTIFRDQKSYNYAVHTLHIPKRQIAASTDGLFINPQWKEVWHNRPLQDFGEDKPIIGINMLSDIPDWINRTTYIDTMRALVNQLIDDGYGVVLIPFQHDFSPNNDYSFMKREIVPYIQSQTGWQLLPKVEIDEIGSVLKQCDAFIGMRFHALLLATALQTPFISLAYDTKCVRFANEVEYPHLIKLEQLRLPTMLEELQKVLRNKQAIQRNLKKIATQQYSEAEECLRKIQF